MAAPTALAVVFPDRQGINDILGEAGAKLRLDDDQSGTVNPAEEAMLTRLYSVATAWVRFHLANYDLSDYPAADNAGHWLVYRWACVHAALNLCKRKGNPATGSLQAMYDEAKETLGLIKAGKQSMSDVAQLASPSASVSNVRLDDFYHTRKLRVERPISDPIAARHGQAKDWTAEVVPERQP